MAKYDDIINGIFFDRYEAGAASVRFERKDLAAKAHQLKIAVPKNLGDIIYSYKYRKCYTNLTEETALQVAERVPFEAKWRLLAQVEVRCYILISNVSGAVKVAPLQILQFPVILPHKFQDAEKFNLQFSDFSEITETADKLRWLRYQKGLRQRDVADYAGIDRSTYVHYEEYGKDLYPPEHMEKIAQLFEVPVDMLLDDYNLFLRNGQGNQIEAIRTKLGLTQRQYADKLGVSLGNLKHWEQNRKQIFKSTWEKYFKQT